MQEINLVNSSIQSDSVNTKKLKSQRIFIVLGILIFLILVLIIWVSFFIFTKKEQLGDIKPTTALVVVTSTLVPTIQATPTNSLPTPTIEVIKKQKYILTDCEIEISAGSEWISSPRGDLSTCGILSTSGTSGFTSLTNYPGTMIAIIPFTQESVFTPVKQKNYQEYLKSMNTLSGRYDPNRDFLYSQKDTQIAGFSAIEAQMYSAKLGETKQVFYQGFTRQYVIVWGGQTSIEFETEIREILASARPLILLPQED